MEERELLEIGMLRIDVSAEESGADPYSYYSWEPYEGSGIGLISSASDESSVRKGGEWRVYFFDDPRVVFNDASEVKLFMDVVSRNTAKG